MIKYEMDVRVRPVVEREKEGISGSCISWSAIVTVTYSFTARQKRFRTALVPINKGLHMLTRFEHCIRFSFSCTRAAKLKCCFGTLPAGRAARLMGKNLRAFILPLILNSSGSNTYPNIDKTSETMIQTPNQWCSWTLLNSYSRQHQ